MTSRPFFSEAVRVICKYIHFSSSFVYFENNHSLEDIMSKASVRNIASGVGLATLVFAQGVLSATQEDYADEVYTAIEALNSNWYNQDTGLWDDAWWQSGNALTTLADFAMLQPDAADSLGIAEQIQNTINNAPQKFAGFINEFYDDQGWWAMGLIHSYDLTGDEYYLETAVDIFNDMQTGTAGPCNGGIFWSKDRTYVNAIANELYLTIAASLANRIPSNQTYAEIAASEWDWFRNSGMINDQNLINDGLNANCENNGLPTWSVNQGVILGALAELSKGSSFSADELLNTAASVAKAAINALSNQDGILVEVDKCETQSSACGLDAKQFKGVFIRNLGYLNQIINDGDIRDFILRNADSVWDNDRDGDNRMGVAWAGPVIAANGAAHGSALDALVAAVRVA
jgi:predicted alpha-1,6-mannanase (GH76 family)